MMSIGMEGKLVQSCTKITVTHNKYGDIEYGTTEDRSCLYRDISLSTRSPNRGEIDVDGIFWFDATDDWALGDVLLFEGEYYRVERLIKARRRVVDNSLKFIKCEVSRQRQIS